MADLQPINFTRGVPAVESFPMNDVIDAAGAALTQHGITLLQYGPALGFAPLREWLAQWQGVQPAHVLTGNGSLELFDFLCRCLLVPGDLVFTEAPTYDRVLTLLRRHRATVVGIPLEPDGPNLAVLAAELQKHVPKLFYLIPDFQNPSGVTCSGAKRRHTVALAERYNFLLCEDAPYRLLRYRGSAEPTLFTLAAHRTLHLSSFTKLLGPGVRLGYLLGEPHL